MSFLISFLVTLFLSQILRRHADSLGLVEHPGGHRKHGAATPVVGGIAMFGGVMLAWLVAPPGLWPALLAGTLVAVAIGAWDDRHQSSYLARFGGQIAAAGIMVAIGGVALKDLGFLTTDDYLFYLGRWSTPLTVFAAVGVMNAVNMSDGMDGLAGSLSLVTIISLLLLTLAAGRVDMISELLIVSAAIAGFLAFNLRWSGRRSALLFMGDGGSLLLGYLLAWYLIGLSQGGGRVMSPVTALWVFALPLFDAVGTMLRRALRGRSPFKSDREHYHHYLLTLGLTVNQTLAAVSGTALVLALVGMAGWYLEIPERWMFHGFLGLFVLFTAAMELLGHTLPLRSGIPREAT